MKKYKITDKLLSFRILCILMVVQSGCMQEPECNLTNPGYFPNEVGTRWIYDRFDSLAMERTTLRVEIVRDSVWKDGSIYKMWVFDKSNLYDTLYVRSTADSVLFYRYLEGSPEEVMLIPLSVGQSWVHPVWVRDSTRVIAKDLIKVQGINYPDAYRIHRRLFAFNDYRTDDRWFVPHVGIVKLENWHYLFGWISKENWFLQDLKLR